MVRQIMISLATLMIISSCKAQNTDSNDIKKNKNMERTTERFDTSTYCLIPDLLHIVLTFKIQNGK